jgi:hypothetical protein
MQVLFAFTASDVSIRNNFFDLSRGNPVDNRGIDVQMTNPAPGYPAPNNINIFNNTFFSSATGNNLFMITLDTEITNAVVQNNLGYAPNANGPFFFFDTSVAGATSCPACNSSNAELKSTSPLFTSTLPFTPANAKPTAGSYAIGRGVPVPIWSDAFGVAQPSPRDMGAVNH